MKARRVAALAAFAALTLLLGAALRPDPREAPSPFIGKAAPAFSLPQLHHPDTRLSPADLRGKVWLLNVWASWCVACRDEHPFLVELSHRGAVPLVGLNHKDDTRNALEWLRRLGDPYTSSVVDADGRVGVAYGVRGVPETFVIDAAGVVRFKHTGAVTPAVWAGTLQPLIQRLQGG